MFSLASNCKASGDQDPTSYPSRRGSYGHTGNASYCCTPSLDLCACFHVARLRRMWIYHNLFAKRRRTDRRLLFDAVILVFKRFFSFQLFLPSFFFGSFFKYLSGRGFLFSFFSFPFFFFLHLSCLRFIFDAPACGKGEDND